MQLWMPVQVWGSRCMRHGMSTPHPAGGSAWVSLSDLCCAALALLEGSSVALQGFSRQGSSRVPDPCLCTQDCTPENLTVHCWARAYLPGFDIRITAPVADIKCICDTTMQAMFASYHSRLYNHSIIGCMNSQPVTYTLLSASSALLGRFPLPSTRHSHLLLHRCLT